VLEKTMVARDREIVGFGASSPGASVGGVDGEGKGSNNDVADSDSEGKRRYLAETKAAEIRVVRNATDLLSPGHSYKAVAMEV
jgi:hypothetical protein